MWIPGEKEPTLCVRHLGIPRSGSGWGGWYTTVDCNRPRSRHCSATCSAVHTCLAASTQPAARWLITGGHLAILDAMCPSLHQHRLLPLVSLQVDASCGDPRAAEGVAGCAGPSFPQEPAWQGYCGRSWGQGWGGRPPTSECEQRGQQRCHRGCSSGWRDEGSSAGRTRQRRSGEGRVWVCAWGGAVGGEQQPQRRVIAAGEQQGRCAGHGPTRVQWVWGECLWACATQFAEHLPQCAAVLACLRVPGASSKLLRCTSASDDLRLQHSCNCSPPGTCALKTYKSLCRLPAVLKQCTSACVSAVH